MMFEPPELEEVGSESDLMSTLTIPPGVEMPKDVWDSRASAGHNMNISDHLKEEICLEGLDGLTPQALFERLKHRREFPISIDEGSKAFIWGYARRLRGIDVYIMEEPRPDLIVCDRRQFLDSRGNLYEPMDVTEDIYPYFPIDDKQLGVRGSCKEYYTRRPFKSTARVMPYEITESPRFRNKIVLVAPQTHREQAILQPDVDVLTYELTIIQYCIMERTARARCQGEITRGKVSLSTMKIDPKSLFYQRSLLIKKGLLKKQSVNMKYGPNRISSAVTILHLPRFYVFYETTLLKAARAAIKQLTETPTRSCEAAVLRAKYGKHLTKAFLAKDYSQIFEQIEESYAILNPEAYLREPNPEKRENMTKKMVKAISLRHPQVDHTNFLQLLPVTDEERDEEEASETCTMDSFAVPIHSSLLLKCTKLIHEAGALGLGLQELSERLGISALDARTACRLLQRYKVVVPVLEDRKKTKLHRYIFFKFRQANRILQKVVGSNKGPAELEQRPLLDLQPVTDFNQVVYTFYAMVTTDPITGFRRLLV